MTSSQLFFLRDINKNREIIDILLFKIMQPENSYMNRVLLILYYWKVFVGFCDLLIHTYSYLYSYLFILLLIRLCTHRCSSKLNSPPGYYYLPWLSIRLKSCYTYINRTLSLHVFATKIKIYAMKIEDANNYIIFFHEKKK